MNNSLLEQLQTRHNLPLLDADNYDLFIYSHRDVVLFFSNKLSLYPESQDVAVILPELLKSFANQLQGALIGTEIERELQARFRFTSWPSLVFLRNGEYLGVITGIRDWADYHSEFTRILTLTTSQPPGFDINKVCSG